MIKTHYSLSDPDSDGMGTFMKAMGRHRLLTPDEEISLGRQVQAGLRVDALIYEDSRKLELLQGGWAQAYKKSNKVTMPPKALVQHTEQARQDLIDAFLALHPGGTDAQLREYYRPISEAGHRAFKRMVEANMRLVVAVSKKYSRLGMELNDLIQEGALGLARGIEKYDPTLGYKLSTYCYWWIRQGMNRALSNQSRSIRLPVHVTEVLSKIRRYSNAFRQVHGRYPSDRELAEIFKANSSRTTLTIEDWMKSLAHYRAIGAPLTSLDVRIGDDKDAAISDLIAAPEDDSICLMDARQAVIQAIAYLPPREQEVISRRFGLLDGMPQSPSAIAEAMGITRGQVRTALITGRKALKRSPEVDLKSFLDAL